MAKLGFNACMLFIFSMIISSVLMGNVSGGKQNRNSLITPYHDGIPY